MRALSTPRTQAYVDDCELLWYYSCARVGSPFYGCLCNLIIPQENLLLLYICYLCIVSQHIIYRMNGNLYFILSEFMVELTKSVKQALASRK